MRSKKFRKNKYMELQSQNATDIVKYYKQKTQKKQDTKSTVFDIVLLVIIIFIVYFIIYKLIVIFIEIKVVNENTDFERQKTQINIQTTTPIPYQSRRNQFQSIQYNKVQPNFPDEFSKQKTRYQPIDYQKVGNVNIQNLNSQASIQQRISHQEKELDQQIFNQAKTPQQFEKLQEQRLHRQKIELLQKIKQNILKQERLKQSQNRVGSESINKLIDQERNKLFQDKFQQPITSNNVQIVDPLQVTPTPQRIYGRNREDLTKFADAPAKPLGFQVNRAQIDVQVIKQAVKFVQLIDKPLDDPLVEEQRNYYEQKYHLSLYQKQIPICVVVPSFNNVQDNRYISNIESILQQQYDNYHIVFIDDASSDNTTEKLKQYLKTKQLLSNKITLVKNQQQMFAMHNLRRAALEFCKPEEIYMIVDGDDRLLGRQVFRLYNAIFQQRKAYFVYTNFITTFGNLGYSRPFPSSVKRDNRYRKYTYVTSHLRAYYTRLFQLIKEEDLRDDDGNYFHAANDVAICLPILQMSHQKVQYVPQITYYYNGVTGLNNHKIRLEQQKRNNKIVRKRSKYFPIPNLFGQQPKQSITN